MNTLELIAGYLRRHEIEVREYRPILDQDEHRTCSLEISAIEARILIRRHDNGSKVAVIHNPVKGAIKNARLWHVDLAEPDSLDRIVDIIYT